MGEIPTIETKIRVSLGSFQQRKDKIGWNAEYQVECGRTIGQEDRHLR